MTILPVKKKREKESTQKSTSASSSDANRQQSGQSSSSSSSKRMRGPEEGPPTKRWIMSSSTGHGHGPSSSSINSGPSLSSPRASSNLSGGGASENIQPEKERNQRKVVGGSPTNNAVDYNSDDEYELQNVRDDEVEAEFATRLAARGLIIKEMVGDGACMFRAIAEQIYGDQEMHGQIRRLCMDYMANNKDHFKEFITENYENYIQRKREENVHGNHVELQAISEMFARPVEVYQYSDEPINVLLPRPEPQQPGTVDGGVGGASTSNPNPSANPQQIQQNPPLRLSYHRAVHYNAILAPNVPTIGIGLGLPGMVPGAADKDLMTKAIATSELEHIEETMLQDKIDMTDYQRTQADIEDQIARESLMSYLNDLEKARGVGGAYSDGPSTSGSGASTSSTSGVPPPRLLNSESLGRGGTSSSSSTATRQATGLYEEMLAAQSLEWDAYTDDVAIAEALLVSQQDYMSNKPGPSGSGGPSSSSQ